jgi:hypothetical protein
LAKAISKANGVRAKPIVAAIASGIARNEIVIQRPPQPSAATAHHRCQVSRVSAREVLWRVLISAPPAAIASQIRGKPN